MSPVTQDRPKVVYPDSDGRPMAENTRQYEYIEMIKGGLDALFRERPDVFVAGDNLWYPVEGDPNIRIALDVYVAFGRPKGHRGSYQQWQEGGLPPQVVFEVLSPSNRLGEMVEKFRFYERYGVEEYYVYDPDRGTLDGWRRQEGNGLQRIPVMAGSTSPRLGVRFELIDGELLLFGPDSRRFATYVELAVQRDQAERRADQAEQRVAELAALLRSLGHEPPP